MRVLFLVLGLLLMGLGLVGVFVPFLPTTPFLLLASLCFSYSSKRLQSFLESSPTLGAYIKNYREGVGVRRQVKIKSLIFLWCTLLLTMILSQNLKATAVCLLVGVLVTIHIVKL